MTWKAGDIDSAFVKSARAPSKMKFVKWVAVSRVSVLYFRFHEDAHVLLTSFVRFSTEPGFVKPLPVRHREKRS